jgi:hypothetical protein
LQFNLRWGFVSLDADTGDDDDDVIVIWFASPSQHNLPRLTFSSLLSSQSTLFSAGYDGKLFLWDTSKPQSPSASRAATAPISSACQLSPNVFVVACIDGS